MKCNWEWLSTYLDGLLSDDKRVKLEEHLKTCEACGAKLEEFARVEAVAKKIPVPQLSEAYWENFASRVQNKLAIRERQKTSPAWMEVLKRFFQPTTSKLAIAGSLATILLVAIVGRDYWKNEAYQPPKFEAVAPAVNDKIDSAQEPAKDESVFRMARPDENKAAADKKRKNEVVSVKAANEGILDSRKNAPAGLAPAEEDTVLKSKPSDTDIQEYSLIEGGFDAQYREKTMPAIDTAKAVSDSQEWSLIRGAGDTKYGGKAKPSIDTAREIVAIRQIVDHEEKELKGELSKEKTEALYVSLAQNYIQLYRLTQNRDDWKKANQRLIAFLKADLSDPTRWWLSQIRNELKKLKK